ncbi:MAG: DUF3316 domain-containing protein [Bacteroidaceae bacterium]|nr:DUF3316 domain-containing protein [Bacteroidaceae bacterium]
MKPTLLLALMLTSMACHANKVTNDSTANVTGERPLMESERIAQRSYLFGIGKSSQLDTYLSPLDYRGPQVTFISRIDRPTKWANGNVHYQGTFQGAFTWVKDQSQRGEELGGHVGYDAGWHYVWQMPHRVTLKAGGLIGTDIGFLYNLRNSNNPAQGRLNVDLSASVGAGYTFRIRRTDINLSYQADIPFFGVMFSPQFGQSYYELYTGNRDHNVCCTYPGNAFSIRQMVMVEIPFKYFNLKAGYLWDVRQSGVNNIKVHDNSHSFLIGFAKRFTLIKK